ncbi:hypothetical protein L210DRAFT_3513467 [Boletus edulis BED1]|uniref:Uncharacterized protein n=1 Tax=Boletus edulis BED1 TaxID=1328754 RepID=A0AAD4BAC1_BOLED|nr:hypothetical protein L210DRAFT_3513467 [Boletus edulis BED1]
MLPANSTPWQELQEPALILDRSDNVLVWYLPSAVSQPNQMAIWQNMKMLQEPLGKTIPASLPLGINNWRTHPDLFRMDADLKGAVNVSLAWFQQGHTTISSDPEASALLKEHRAANGVKQWVEQSRDQWAILSGAMAIMHPDMYA